MNLIADRHLLLCVALVYVVAFASHASSAGDQIEPAETEMSWDSPKMRKMESGYQSILHATSRDRDKNSRRNRLIDSLYRKWLSEEDLGQLAAECDSLPVRHNERSPFANDALGFIVRSLVDLGDREMLMKLLSTRCPGRVRQFTTLEFYLAYYGRTMKDPILILGEAYSRCTIPEVRHDIAAAVRRGFRGLGVHGKDDADFVATAMKWYEREKEHLVVNVGFRSVDYKVSVRFYERHPEFYDKDLEAALLLFRKRASSAERPYHEAASRESASGTADDRVGGSVESSPSERSERAPRTLEGAWRVIKLTQGGRTANLKGRRCVIAGETLTGKLVIDRDQEFRMRFPKHQPGAIDLTTTSGLGWEGAETTPLITELLVQTTPGIYELNEDTLRICLAKRDAYRRPTSFDAYEGSGRTLIVLKRPSMVGPVALGLMVALVVAALLLLPKWGLYRRWKRKAMASGTARK